MPLPNPGMSFTPFDPLPASDLNDIVENIEALADGSAAVTALSWADTALANPYKFSVYRGSSNQTVASGFVKVQLNTELFDTNNNFDGVTNHRYVAPVNGFYFF